MNLLSRRSLLAIAAVVDVAMHARPVPAAAKSLAARHNLPPRHLETLLQTLVRSGILKGVRGPRGGYRLARERRRISVAEVVRVVQGLEEPEGADRPVSDSALGTKVIGPFWEGLEAELITRLEAISIEELCQRAEREAVDSESRRSFDFVI